MTLRIIMVLVLICHLNAQVNIKFASDVANPSLVFGYLSSDDYAAKGRSIRYAWAIVASKTINISFETIYYCYLETQSSQSNCITSIKPVNQTLQQGQKLARSFQNQAQFSSPYQFLNIYYSSVGQQDQTGRLMGGIRTKLILNQQMNHRNLLNTQNLRLNSEPIYLPFVVDCYNALIRYDQLQIQKLPSPSTPGIYKWYITALSNVKIQYQIVNVCFKDEQLVTACQQVIYEYNLNMKIGQIAGFTFVVPKQFPAKDQFLAIYHTQQNVPNCQTVIGGIRMQATY